MQFEKYQVYEFNYAGKSFQNGADYYLLTFKGQNSMPEYADEGWVFRAEILDFQQTMTIEEGAVIKCFVAGLVKDIDGTETAFPILKQDFKSILMDNFEIGKTYTFSVIAVPGNIDDKLEKIDYYIVRDPLGIQEHHLYTSAEYKIGDSVELTVDRFDSTHLGFADPVRQKIKEFFEVGKEYTFKIESEALDEKSGKNFFALRDNVENCGFIHCFYFSEDRSDGPGNDINLIVKAITPKGWLLLAEPGAKISAKELQTLEQIEDNTLGRENEQLEYKSSFVFTADSAQNIDKQLGMEIMQQLAAFMNAKGGMVCLGYQDDGSICGINNDIQYLNSSTEDEYSYKPTLDGIELKIRNTIYKKLGGFANSMVSITFRKSTAGSLVCHLIAQPSSKPIYLNGTALYKRSGNMCQRLKGDEITFFIWDHLDQMKQSAVSAATTAILPPAQIKDAETVEVKQDEKDKEIAFTPVQPAINEKILQYITLYKDGTATRQRTEQTSDDVLFNIPFTAKCRNQKARLLFCYDNGCVNVLNPQKVATEKLKKPGYPYRNGFNKDAALLSVFTCSKDDYLVIRSKKHNDGIEMIKALAIGGYEVHEPHSMQTQGNKVLEVKNAAVDSYEIVKDEHSSFIHPVIVKSKNGALGIPANSAKAQNVIAFLKKLNRRSDAEEARS